MKRASAAGYLSAVEYAAPRPWPRNLPRRIDHRSRLFCITSASAGRAFSCFSGMHAMIAFRSWTPCSSMIHVPSRSPASPTPLPSLSYRDIFYTGAMEGLTSFPDASEYFKIKRDSRVLTLAFTYRFGRSYKVTRHTVGATEEKERVQNG